MFFKKAAVLATTLLISLSTYAGHEVGGMIITYESVAHVNNNNLEYVITVFNLVDNGGIPSPAAVTVTQTSSCYSTVSHSLPRVSVGTNGLLPLIGSDYCSPSTSIQSTIGLAIYRDTVILPGTCINFKFAINGGVGRYSSTANIANGFGSCHFEVKLNNMAGPNSTPTLPILDVIQAACIGKPLNLYNFIETDGDSLHFGPGFPQMSATSNYSYGPGYSVVNQIGSTSGFNVNPLTGSLQTQANGPGQFLITINYAEYRKNPSTQQNVFVGGGQFNLVLFVTTGCVSKPFDMVYRSATNPDSLACRDSIVRFATTRKIAIGSLTSNGSEFTVQSIKSGNLNVLSARVITDSIVELAFAQPFASNDTLEIRAKVGTDGNVVLSRCGKELLVDGDTLWFYSPNAGNAVATFSTNTNLLSASFSSSGSQGSGFQWDFGDGSPMQTSANPTHTYTAPGLYSVTLIAFNTCGLNDTVIQSIRVCDSLLANFSSTINGDTVFTDAGSSSGASQYYWDFGDGNSGTGINSSHIYAQGGAYLITLTVVNLCGDSTLVTDSVKLCEDALADWTYTVVSTTSNGMLVDFDGTASLRATTYEWNFGDGNSDNTTLTPQHLYATPSLSYFVTLTVYNDCNEPNIRAFRLNQIGLEEIAVESFFEIYPNPAKGKTTLQWEGGTVTPKTIELINSSGKLVRALQIDDKAFFESKLDLSLDNLASGMYFLKIKGNGFTISKKLMID